MEEWKAIPGYEGYYEVSDLGNVRSLPRKIICANGVAKALRGVTLRPYYEKGYPRVFLNGKIHIVSRLVCHAFNGEPPSPSHVAAHYPDKDTRNNAATNLVWATRATNSAHMIEQGTAMIGAKNPFFGKTHTDETRSKLRAAHNRTTATCEYCAREMDIRNIVQWHGERCKFKTAV